MSVAVHMGAQGRQNSTVKYHSVCLLNKLEQVSVKSSGFLCSARHTRSDALSQTRKIHNNNGMSVSKNQSAS